MRHIRDRSDEADPSLLGKVDGLVVSLPSLYLGSTREKPLYWYLTMKNLIQPFSTKHIYPLLGIKRKHGTGAVSYTQKTIFVQDIKGSGFGGEVKTSILGLWRSSSRFGILAKPSLRMIAVLTFLLFGIQVTSRFNTATKMLVTASMLHSR